MDKEKVRVSYRFCKEQFGKTPEECFIDRVNAGELEIDSKGRIWRLKIRRRGLLYPCKRRRAENGPVGGYFCLRAMMGGRRVHVGAHRVVYWYFHGAIPHTYEVNHDNGIKTDNHPDNLEALTPGDNARHAHRTGLID